jgi:pyruvate-formate lyase-activating enzyme
MSKYARKLLHRLGIYRFRETSDFILRHKILGKPYYWTDFPLVFQIDISNYCGPKYSGVFCEYCWPQWKICKGDWIHGEMPMEQIDWVLQQISKYGKDMLFYTLFLNGDGLTDPRLPEILKLGKKYSPHLPIQTFTCGTKTENAWMLCDENLDLVCFTVSAHTPDLYLKVHRGNQFANVLKTMDYVTANRKSNQKLEVHYVITENNFKYMADWHSFMSTRYPEWKLVFSPLVASFDNYPSLKALGQLTLEQQENAILQIDSNARFWDARTTGLRQPCVLWNNAAITCDGTLLQCCNWCEPKWNYGNIADYMREGWSLRDYWLERLANKQRNVLCRSCNLRHPDWKQRLESINVNVNLRL